MRIAVQSSDVVDVLCRSLDQIRRMGIGMVSVEATGSTGEIVFVLNDPDPQLALTLRARIETMAGASSVGTAGTNCLEPA